MKEIVDWYRIKREASQGDPLPEIKEMAELRYVTGGEPKQFAVVRAMQYDMAQPKYGRRLVYFSPVACSWLWEWIVGKLLDARKSESPAHAPEGTEAFGFVCGDKAFVDDLLKDLLK